MLCTLLRLKSDNVTLFSKVSIVQIVLLSRCTAECKSKMTNVRYALLLLGTSVIENSVDGGIGIGQ